MKLRSGGHQGQRDTFLANLVPYQEDYGEKGASAPGAEKGQASTSITTEKDRLNVDDAALGGDGYGVGAISRAELRENASHMSFYGVL